MNAASMSPGKKLSAVNPQNKFVRDVKMQASTVKESNADQVANTKILPDQGKPTLKPPAINQDLTNKVFSNIEQMSGQAKASQNKDRNGTSDKIENKENAEEQYKVKNQNQLKIKKNHFDALFSKLVNVPNPQFIKQYAELFVESRILERIIPRDVSKPDELEFFNPYLIRDTVTEKLVPEGVSPYVGSDLTGVNRVSQIIYAFLYIYLNFALGCD